MSITDIEYVAPGQLRKWFTTGSPTGSGKFAVVDVRDSDYIGGHIKGCLHYPSTSFYSTVAELVKNVSDKDDVVFHCALSQQRGPSAAMKFLREAEKDIKGKKVWVLEGGFTEWQALYGEDVDVTEGFIKDLWR